MKIANPGKKGATESDLMVYMFNLSRYIIWKLFPSFTSSTSIFTPNSHRREWDSPPGVNLFWTCVRLPYPVILVKVISSSKQCLEFGILSAYCVLFFSDTLYCIAGSVAGVDNCTTEDSMLYSSFQKPFGYCFLSVNYSFLVAIFSLPTNSFIAARIQGALSDVH